MRISDWSSDVCSSDLQDAKVNFSAFNRQTTPEIHGVLGLVSAKPIEDPRTGRSYYQARIDLPQTELEKLGNLNLVPGMPAEVYIRRSEEHTSELQSLMRISYAVFCLKKKKYQYMQPQHNSHITT